MADKVPEELHLAMATTRHRDQAKPHPEHLPCISVNVCLKTKQQQKVSRPVVVLEVKKKLCHSQDALGWEGVLLTKHLVGKVLVIILVQETT